MKDSNVTFFPVFVNALHQKYRVNGLPPFVGEFADVGELPKDHCSVPFYYWQKPNKDIVFSCNKPLMESFAMTLAIQKRFVDVTVGDILQAVDNLCELHKKSFTTAMQALLAETVSER
ncbi:hypothetical protein [Acidithiobacillus albertensis]|jgi:hypothetical protein|uniref:hypothetical protein n=1 Tax=Acidithiobacillus albertensis TaxID=119978 RepID=UPI00094B0A93|nr:hypothetical protein [Acidithiobacillus albertensis]